MTQLPYSFQPAPGCLLNQRYQVEQLLGSGGFSQTYQARDLHKPSYPVCVIKHLRPASSDTHYLQTAHSLFHAEAASLERLGSHSQIPSLLAYFEEQQNFFLVQDYVDGQLLTTELQPGCTWTEPQVLVLLRDILKILEFVHGHGIIHRDIKPDNLIRRNGDCQIVLIDFGSVKQIRTSTMSGQTHSNATIAIGTKGYIAPEQGQGNPSARSDLYSLGMIAIQALTGLDPTRFQHDSQGEICWQTQSHISSALADLIYRLSAFHFKDRYVSATDALSAVMALLEPSLAGATQSFQAITPTLLAPLPTSTITPPTQSLPSMAPPTPLVSSVSTSFLAATATNPTLQSQPILAPASLQPPTQPKAWVKYGLGTGIAATTLLTIGICTMPTNTDSTTKKQDTTAIHPGQAQRKTASTIERQQSQPPRSPAMPLPAMVSAPATSRTMPATPTPSIQPPVAAQPIVKSTIAVQPRQSTADQPAKRETEQHLHQVPDQIPKASTIKQNTSGSQQPKSDETEVQLEIYEEVRIPLLTEPEQMEKFTAALQDSSISKIIIADNSVESTSSEALPASAQDSDLTQFEYAAIAPAATDIYTGDAFKQETEAPIPMAISSSEAQQLSGEADRSNAAVEQSTPTTDYATDEPDQLEPVLISELPQPEVVESPEVATPTPQSPAAISPDGQYLAGIGADNEIKVWSLHTGELLHLIQTESGSVQSITFSEDSHRLATVSAGGTIEYWNLHLEQSTSTYH